ncbi:beta-glucuronosyltransferase GlcAT14A-like [Helianthus annuus]|uniref:beta-glucuronosyltransferase GlcAT14A-like n=1 Tax=Helianthus annuus TaxID=4232 RepID=UPI000B8FAF2B|nr:beta-glucuronosyltransferase GlcAT14A-like [Helianthus annuus]
MGLFRPVGSTSSSTHIDGLKSAKQTNKTGSSTTVSRFAYLVSGSKGDLNKLWSTVRALYHPWNYYVLHLDLESPLEERTELASRVENDLVFSTVGNVYVITKANMVTYRGPTMVSNTLHACAILIRKFKDWDWFINLSASDYLLVTQDVSRYLNWGNCRRWLGVCGSGSGVDGGVTGDGRVVLWWWCGGGMVVVEVRGIEKKKK